MKKSFIRFITIVGVVLFILLIGCSNMVERLRLLSWENIDVYISYYDEPVTEFELGIKKETVFSFIFVDRKDKKIVNNYSFLKNIVWNLPEENNFFTMSTNQNRLSLFLTGQQVTTNESYEISVTVNGKKSYPCRFSVGSFYEISDRKDLEEIRQDVHNSSVTEIRITGDELVSDKNFLIQLAQSLPKREGDKYTLDLTAAKNVDLSRADDMTPFNSSIGKIILPEELTEIGQNAFWGFEALTEITIPPKVTKIGKNAFGSSGLTEITIPASVMTIEEKAFSACQSLKKVTFESRTVPITIEMDAFILCISLSEVIIDQNSGVLITGPGVNNLKKYIKNPTTP